MSNSQEILDSEINLLDILKILTKYKFFILLIVIVSTSITFFLISQKPKLYKASATILQTDAVTSSMGGLRSLLNSFSIIGGGSSLGRGGDQGGVLGALIKSRVLAKSVIEETNLLRVVHKKQWDKNRQNWMKGYAPKLEEDAIELYSAVELTSSTGGVLEITVIYDDPQLAALLANTYVKKLAEYISQNSLNVSFKELDPAFVPTKPIDSNIKQNILSSVLFSFVIGSILSFLINYFVEFLNKKDKNIKGASLNA